MTVGACDALIFDLDGTLWDTCETCADAWNPVLARLGIAHRQMTAADVRAVAGLPHLEAIRRAFPGLTESQILELAGATAEADNEAVARHGGTLYPGVREHVLMLCQRVPLLIVSNSQQGYIETFLAWSRLAACFTDFECWGNTGRTKSENVAELVRRNRLSRPLLVGDTDGDREAAEANGLRFVYASYGFGSVPRYDHRIEYFADLVSLVI